MSRFRRIEQVLPPGYAIGYPVVGGTDETKRKLGGHSGHPYILRPDGSPLRDASGMPIKISTSPRRRTVDNEIARIRRALRTVDVR